MINLEHAMWTKWANFDVCSTYKVQGLMQLVKKSSAMHGWNFTLSIKSAFAPMLNELGNP